MKVSINIENSSGTKQGSGPIDSATRWRTVARLDRIGEIDFEMPGEDEKGDPVAEKMVARAWGVINNTRTDLGAGIIDHIGYRDNGDGRTTKDVSGNDLLKELTYRTVGNLSLYRDVATYQPTSAWYQYWDGYNPVAAEVPNVCDGNPVTYTDINLQSGSDDAEQYSMIIFRYTDREFKGLWLGLDAGYVNNNACTMYIQFWDGNDWVNCSNVSNGTIVGGAPLAQSGWITWDKPEGQAKYSNLYIIRLLIRDGGPNFSTDTVRILESLIKVELPSLTALADIMAFAPAGWSLDTDLGLAATVNDVYTSFAGENVFQALARVAEITGEHFRLGVGRKVVWLGETTPSSGIRAVQGGDTADIAAVSNLCLIKSLEVIEESYDIYSRILPYGGGIGSARVSLADTTREAPVGYFLDTGNNFIRHTAAEAAYGQIEQPYDNKDITLKDMQQGSRTDAANQLFDAAIKELERHSTVYAQYSLTVTGLKTTLYPGQTIKVVYRRSRNGYKAIDINTDLIILETATEIDTNGVLSVQLTVATKDYWGRSEVGYLVQEAKQGATYRTNTQQVDVSRMVAPTAPAGTVPIVAGNGAIVFRPLSGYGSVGGAYLPLAGGTMTGTASLQATAAQGNNLIASVNTGSTQIDWARVNKGTSNLTDLVTRQHAGLTDIGANDHHTQIHDILSADHTYTGGAAYDVFGLSAANTIAKLTPSYDVSAGASALLRSNAGALTLATLTTNTLNLGADVQLTRSAANVLALAAGDSFQHADYAIDSDGARITDTGHGYFRYLYATEFHAKSFIADLEQALAGGQIICKSVAPLAADFTAPAAGATADLVVQEFQGFGAFHVFVDGDFINIRSFGRSGSSLTIGDCWGTVVYASRDATAQTQTYTFTRRSGTIGAGNAPGSIAATTVIGKGTLALDYGTTGNGYIESVAQSGAMASGVPYQQIVTWATEPGVTANKTIRTRIGNLNGSYGIVTDLFGIGLGYYHATEGNYLRYDTTNGFLLKAGSGGLGIDGEGIKFNVPASYTTGASIKFQDGGTTIGETYFYKDANMVKQYHQMSAVASRSSDFDYRIYAPSGKYGQISFMAGVNEVNGLVSLTMTSWGSAGSRSISLSAPTVNIDGGLNVGTATGAATGQVKLNQGAGDGEILTLQSSDVAHGMTGITETNTYGLFQKYDASAGGLSIGGYCDTGAVGIHLGPIGETEDTTKSTAAVGAAMITVATKSGAGTQAPKADSNLFVVRSYTSARFIFDAEGSAHADVEWTTYDDYDDVALLTDLERALIAQKDDSIKRGFVDFLKYNHSELETAKIVHFDEKNPGHAMVNTTRLSMLLAGAVRQLNDKISRLEKMIPSAS